jgi:tryptophan 2,3-dioxygenase
MREFTSFGLPVPPDGPPITYGGYLKTRELTALQELRSEPAQHDETLFIIIHQTYELWFKQLLHELGAVVGLLDADQPLGAQRLLQRCIEIERVLLSQVSVLETMTPVDFLAFRDRLTPASGFQSAQFRGIEYLSGSKNAGFLKHYPEGSPERAMLEARLAEPSVKDAFYSLLRRRGFDLPDDPEGPDADDSPEHRRRIQELARIYRDAEAHYTLFLLAESLVGYDEHFLLWRLRHVAMVERMIGSKPGTGGSSGVDYLRHTTAKKFFPDLWELRTVLGAPAAE